MFQYNWRRVLFLDFCVLLIGTAFIVVTGFTGNELLPPRCDATSEAGLSSLAVLILSVAVVETLRWTRWRLSERPLHRGEQSQIDADATPHAYYWKFAIAMALIIVSIRLGPPNPCERLRLDASSLSMLVGNLGFVCGFLLMFNAKPLAK